MQRLTMITLYEHKEKKYEDIEGNKETIQNALIKLNSQFRTNFERIEKSDDNTDTEEELDESRGVVEIYTKKVKARHYVGFAAVGNVFIQILPKVFEPKSKDDDEETWNSLRAFVRMLDRAYGLNIREYDLAYLKGRKLRPNLYEVFVYLFAKSLWNEIQRGYHREYVELHSEEKFLRGKLLLNRQIRKLPHQLNMFSVEVHELIENNLLNRIFYACIREAMRRTTWSTNKKFLGELMLVFDSVTPIHITREHFERVHFTRLNERFKRPFELAKLLFMPASGEGRAREISGFFVDMNKLFEKFIGKVIGKNLPDGYDMSYQEEYPFLKNPSLRKENDTVLSQRPDYVIMRNDTPIIVLDAKYRELKRNTPDSDMARQLYVYSQILRKDSKYLPPTVLMFPSSRSYNPNLADKHLKFEFFDGIELNIIAYDMESLKEGNIKEADKKFAEALRRILNGKGQNHP